MGIIENWSYRWFGLWREQGVGFEKCPSIKDFIDPDLVKGYPLFELYSYLGNCQKVAATSGFSLPDPFTGEVIKESVCYVTDGEWLWLDSLPYYIEKYQVAIPADFLRNIDSNNYKPIELSIEVEHLDWPSL